MRLAIFGVCALLAACGSQPLTPGAERIQVVKELPTDKQCRFIAEIVVSGANWFTDDLTSSHNQLITIHNEFRNQALAYGGTHVVKGDTLKGSFVNRSASSVGSVYECFRTIEITQPNERFD